MTHLKKFGLAVIRDRKLLLCKPFAYNDLIVPGGIIEGDETAEENLTREVTEELGALCSIRANSLKYVGEFTDAAAGKTDRLVTVFLYRAELDGEMFASSEIKELIWFGAGVDENPSAVVKNKIIPFFIKQGELDAI